MINPKAVRQNTIVRIKAALLHEEFVATAKVVSQHDRPGCVDVRHPTFQLLEDTARYKAGCEFWGTFEDVIEIINHDDNE
jgi:hypothetical protein